MGVDGGGVPIGPIISLEYSTAALQLSVYNDEVGPTISFARELMTFPAINKWLRISGIIRLNTAGSPNGLITAKGVLLEGDMVSGSYGAELMTVFDKTFINQEMRRDANGLNRVAVMGSTGLNSGSDVVTVLIDNLKVFDA